MCQSKTEPTQWVINIRSVHDFSVFIMNTDLQARYRGIRLHDLQIHYTCYHNLLGGEREHCRLCYSGERWAWQGWLLGKCWWSPEAEQQWSQRSSRAEEPSQGQIHASCCEGKMLCSPQFKASSVLYTMLLKWIHITAEHKSSEKVKRSEYTPLIRE